MIDKRCVVILGAGASKPFGVPVAKELLDHKKAESYLGKNSSFKEKLERLREEKCLATNNPEEILTDVVKAGHILPVLLEGANLKSYEDELKEFRRHLYLLLKACVFDGISSQYKNPAREKSKELIDPHPWKGFFKYCEKFTYTTWCSFNWDCILESSFFYHFRENLRTVVELENYWGEKNLSKKHHLLKLHGGVNWWRKDDSDPSPDKPLLYLKIEERDTPGRVNYDWNKFEKREASGEPAILEPSAYKYESPIFDLLKSQWKHFDCELKNADIIIVIGYSIPDLDQMARASIELAAKVNTNAKIAVFDPCTNAFAKYQKIFENRCVKHFKDLYGKAPDPEILSALNSVMPMS